MNLHDASMLDDESCKDCNRKRFIMRNTISFPYGAVIDNSFFYDYIWEKVYLTTQKYKSSNVILDFSNVKKIMAPVLPKLCCLGAIARDSGIDLEINLNPASELKDYLDEIGFFDIAVKEGLYILSEGQIGGAYNKSRITNALMCFNRLELVNKYKKKYIFSSLLGEEDVLKYCISAEVLGEQYLTNTGEITDDMINRSPVLSVIKIINNDKEFIKNIALDFVEIILNALWHAETDCFFSVQAGTYKGEKIFKKLDICVSDFGTGLYDTLRKKDWENDNKSPHTMSLDKFLSINADNERNLYSILEMIYFRSEDVKRGIYDIMNNLTDKQNLHIYFINRNTHLFIDNNKDKNSLNEVLHGNYENNIKYVEKESINYGFSMDISFCF